MAETPSTTRPEAGAEAIPSISFPDDLPVSRRREEIALAIQAHPVIIVCGETGSGKTTQLPKICLEAGRGLGTGGIIGHTQPRRIAARSVAARIASELETPLGQFVGYKVRFTDRLSESTRIKVMTDGILLAETQRDRLLKQYDTLIIDEAHERSLNIDFLLGYLKQLLPKRPDLKVIITSATIDPQRFSAHFDGAPIIEVSGRTYPVEVRHRPVQSDEPDEEDSTVLQAILSAVDEVSDTTEGDVLIFLSGEREIRETAEALRKHHPPHTEIIPLYARLSTEEQNRVFQPLPPGVTRRIVLATNVAETSLTVPGIRYVIDPGLARISRYSANARVQRLPIEPISRASADQRKGRCGRIGPGVCIRLYSQEDYEGREPYTDPEILRANLASVILQMKALRLGDIERFPFIDPPRPAMIREGYQTLHELGAIDDRHRLTRLGSELARLPIDPRLGRMILAARQEKSLREVLVIASALATQDPRLRPADAQAAAAQEQFADDTSDFLSHLKIWTWYHEKARELSTNKLRRLCQQNHLSYVRLREWHDVHTQLHTLVRESRMKPNTQPASYESIHRALLTGLLNNIGLRAEGGGHEYAGPRDRKFHIFPGSALFKKGPKWLMAAELVETTRLYARTVARIHPEWIERVGAHLLKRSHSDPHWNEKSAHVEAYERIAMHGLVIVPKRRIHFGPINPELSREIFIHQALVEGALPRPFNQAPFFQHNRALMEQYRTSEAKSRRRNVMVSEAALYAFYDRRLPPGIYDGPSFEKWRREAEGRDPRVLFMSSDDLLRSDAQLADPEQFPDFMNISGIRLPLSYRLDPGAPDDGVTMHVPVEAVNQISQEEAEWLVPGLLREKIAALLRTLPKSLRRHFVPAPDHAEAAVKSLGDRFGEGDLLEALSRELHRRVGVPVPRDAWRPELLPHHLRMNFAVEDAKGNIIVTGRDLQDVRRILDAARTDEAKTTEIPIGSATDPAAPSSLNLAPRHSITTWTFGDLPEKVPLRRGEFTVFGYPALVDEGHSVSIQIFDHAAAAARAHRAGTRRLFVLQVRDELAAHVEYLPNIDELALLYSVFGPEEQFRQTLVDLVADRVFIAGSEVRTQNEFDRRLRSGWDRLWPTATEVNDLVSRILTAHQAVEVQLAGFEDVSTPPMHWQAALEDIRAQLRQMFASRFLLEAPDQWLQQYPRYLAAIQARLRKLAAGNLTRDARAMQEVNEHWRRYLEVAQRTQQNIASDPALDHYRWMIEELRVSLFAQELGTLFPVSSKRLESQWATVRK